MALEIVGRQPKQSNWKVRNGRVQFHIPILQGGVEVIGLNPFRVRDSEGTEYYLMDTGMERLVTPPLDVRDNRYFHNTFTLDKRGDTVYLTVVADDLEWEEAPDYYRETLQNEAPQIMSYIHQGGWGSIQR